METYYYEHPAKCYLKVWAAFDPAGQIYPLGLEWEGRKVAIDRILDVRPGASRKAGGSGMRYLCRIHGHELPLYLEEKRWFVERQVFEEALGMHPPHTP